MVFISINAQVSIGAWNECSVLTTTTINRKVTSITGGVTMGMSREARAIKTLIVRGIFFRSFTAVSTLLKRKWVVVWALNTRCTI